MSEQQSYPCPRCQQPILYKLEFVGEKFNCPKCKTPFVMQPLNASDAKKLSPTVGRYLLATAACGSLVFAYFIVGIQFVSIPMFFMCVVAMWGLIVQPRFLRISKWF